MSSDETTGDGGPAFPVTRYEPDWGCDITRSAGMSLRDWFAGQALAGLSTDDMWTDYCGDRFAYLADTSYRMADAMLAARTKGGGQ
jgi:hypothetical protein